VLVAASDQTVKADFLAATIDTVNKAVKFVNLSKPAITFAQWDFGDGTASTNIHPEHTWFSPTDYSVTLLVGNNFCTDKITKQLSVIFRNYMEEQLINGGFAFGFTVLHPNPTKNSFQLHIEIPIKSDVTIVITDVLGRIIYRRSLENKNHFFENFSLEENAAGIYFIKIQAQSEFGTIYKTLKVLKEN
jgi:PKD repeat protein